MKIKSLTQTCFCCPSQWEGLLDDGRSIYIRYRYGKLFVGIGNTKDEAVRSSELVQTITDKFSSFMTTEKMLGFISKSCGLETDFHLKVEESRSSYADMVH